MLFLKASAWDKYIVKGGLAASLISRLAPVVTMTSNLATLTSISNLASAWPVLSIQVFPELNEVN